MTSLLQEMKARGALLEPTLFVFSRQPRDAELLSWGSRATARAHALGVGIVAGTDGLIGDNPTDAPNIHRELELLVAAGLSPLEALRAATGNAARALGIEDRTGTIRPGLAANLVVLNADPLADIRNTRRIARVIQRGVDVAR
jgi:imidazolonepropionase-like amidohydrolase